MKVLICDNDEYYSSEGKKHLLACAARHGIPIVVEIVPSGEKLLFYQDTKYKDTDVIYMESHLPGISGLETARELRKSGFVGDIIFYTGDETHIDEGYEVDAIAYLIKGKEMQAKFEEIFLKSARRSHHRYETFLTVNYRDEERHIPIRQILYFEVRDHLVTVYYWKYKQVESFEFRSTLKKLADQLDDEDFWRCHKSFLVSKRHIYRVTTDQIEMFSGALIPKTQNE